MCFFFFFQTLHKYADKLSCSLELSQVFFGVPWSPEAQIKPHSFNLTVTQLFLIAGDSVADSLSLNWALCKEPKMFPVLVTHQQIAFQLNELVSISFYVGFRGSD